MRALVNAPKSKNTDWLCDCQLNLSLIAASLIIAHVFIPKELAALIYSFRNSNFGIMPPHPNPLPRGEGAFMTAFSSEKRRFFATASSVGTGLSGLSKTGIDRWMELWKCLVKTPRSAYSRWLNGVLKSTKLWWFQAIFSMQQSHRKEMEFVLRAD